MSVRDIEKVVYICHEYGGDPENVDKVAKLIKALVAEHPNYCFISPIHSFGYMYDTVSYEQGMIYCLTLLDLCSDMWTFGNRSNSRGCRIEKAYCKKYNIPIDERGDYNGI